jgi:hypothetical protein
VRNPHRDRHDAHKAKPEQQRLPDTGCASDRKRCYVRAADVRAGYGARVVAPGSRAVKDVANGARCRPVDVQMDLSEPRHDLPWPRVGESAAERDDLVRHLFARPM